MCLALMRLLGASDYLPDEGENKDKKEVKLNLGKSNQDSEKNKKINVKE